MTASAATLDIFPDRLSLLALALLGVREEDGSATLARDVKRLAPFGYRLRAARMLDMFPRTRHFETAVWLSLG